MTKKYSLGLVGRKAGMTRVFTDDGKSVPVTVIEATAEPRHPGQDRRDRRLPAVQVTFGAQARRA